MREIFKESLLEIHPRRKNATWWLVHFLSTLNLLFYYCIVANALKPLNSHATTAPFVKMISAKKKQEGNYITTHKFSCHSYRQAADLKKNC